MTFDFFTPFSIIKMGLFDVGLLEEGQDPNSYQMADGINRLNRLILFEMTQGVKLWTQQLLSFTPVSGQTAYVWGPGGDINMTKPYRIIDGGYYQDSFGNQVPMTMLGRVDWLLLQRQPQNNGTPVNYYVDKQAATLVLNVWPAPDSNAAQGTINMVVQTQATTMQNLSDSLAFPIEWGIWLEWAFALQKAAGQPEAVIAHAAKMEEFYRIALENWDVEDASVILAADPQRGYRTGAFR